MIAYLTGEVLYSDNQKSIIHTDQGVGYHVYCNDFLTPGKNVALFITQVIREDAHTLFSFKSVEEKNFFDLLLRVKGVGPKSAFSLMKSLGPNQISQAILLDNKKILQKAPGIGAKAAAQIVLDLKDKLPKFTTFDNTQFSPHQNRQETFPLAEINHTQTTILNETLMACKELGFNEDKVLPLAHNILQNNEVSSSEQMVQLVLKEI